MRWYQHIHPDDKQRWSLEAAEMFLSGKPLRSAYRVIARDGRVVWFHCEAQMVRRADGPPWFIHGVGFDITDLKHTEEALQEERNVCPRFSIRSARWSWCSIRWPHRALQSRLRATTGCTSKKCRGAHLGTVHDPRNDALQRSGAAWRIGGRGLRKSLGDARQRPPPDRLVGTMLPGSDASRYIIATGIDITERKQLEKALLEISAREQRRIGQDLHDGLGQHLTGIAFMGKVLEQKLADRRCRKRPTPPRSSAGERSDQQDARTGARAAAGGLRRPRADVGAAALGRRSGGPLRSLLPVRLRSTGADSTMRPWPRICITSRRKP